jgi:hypothetical protein
MNETFSTSLLPSQFEVLARVGQLLARALDASQGLREVLRTLEIKGHLSRGMIAVVDPESGDLGVYAVHGLDHDDFGRSVTGSARVCSAASSKAGDPAR